MTPKYSIGLYKITYKNGFIQKKHLIPQKFYRQYKNFNLTIAEMSETTSKRKKNKDLIKNLVEERNILFGDDFFTCQSPLGKAIKTGIICLPKIQGGCNVVKIIEIK